MGLETPHTQGSREQPAAEELAQKPQGPTDAGTTASPGAPGVFPGWVEGGGSHLDPRGWAQILLGPLPRHVTERRGEAGRVKSPGWGMQHCSGCMCDWGVHVSVQVCDCQCTCECACRPGPGKELFKDFCLGPPRASAEHF